jgi:glycosyltransferase involved in cell wall biosynthesis
LPSGGGKRALYHHVKGLLARGHKIEAWTLDTADRSYLPLENLVAEHVVPFDSERSSRFGRVAQKASDYYDGVTRIRAYDDACRRCAEAIDAGKFDLLFANSSVLYYMPFVMRHVRIPKVLYLQEPYRPLYEANPMLPWLTGTDENVGVLGLLKQHVMISKNLHLHALRLQAKLEWLNAQASDLILVNSHYSRESVLRAYGREAKTCYLGVDTAQFRDLNLKRERFIVSLGSFNEHKGVELSLRSLALLPEPRPPLVWIANSTTPGYVKQMWALAASLGLDFQIKSRISDTELVEILNRASILLYAPRLEPFGLAPLEANACGTPVVGIAEGGLRETILDGTTGFLVDREPEAIAVALQKLLDDPMLAQKMGAQGAARVREKWDWESAVDRLEKYLLETAGSRG